MTTATIYHPSLISIPASPYCELVRLVLDARGIPYAEQCHAPVFQVLASCGYGAGKKVPVLHTGEVCLLDARAVVNYYEARAPFNQKLYPVDSAVQAEARQLFDFFFDTFGVATCTWACTYMLPMCSSMRYAWTECVPWWERLGSMLFYPFLAALARRNLALKPDSISREQKVIETALSQVESRLSDGRRFLLGDTFSAPDLALAALAAPIMIPREYGGLMSTLDQLPSEMRNQVAAWRARPSGQFIARLYAENRPQRVPDLVALGKHGSGRTTKGET